MARKAYALQGIGECGPVASLWSFGSGALLGLLRLGFRINAVIEVHLSLPSFLDS